MAEYIEKEAALKMLCAPCNALPDDNICPYRFTGCKQFYGIFSLPAAAVVSRDCYDRLLAENDELRKVRPVVYGEWVWEEPNSANRFRGCFLCNKCFESVYVKKNFCPNCGARMDGDADAKE